MLHFACAACGRVNRVPEARLGGRPTCGGCHAALDVGGAPVLVDDDALERLIRASPVPVLVDFYADWCGPCRVLAPALAQLATAHRGALIVVKVDTERSQRVAGGLMVRGIPAVFLFKAGAVVEQATGAHPLPFWERMVSAHLAPA